MKRLLISLLLFSSILLGGWSKIEALTQGWAPPEDYRSEESLEIVIEPSEEENPVIDESKEEMSMAVKAYRLIKNDTDLSALIDMCNSLRGKVRVNPDEG